LGSRREFLKTMTFAASAAPFALAADALPRAKDKRPGAAPSLVEMNGARSLRDHAESRGLLVGCAVVPDRLTNEADYASLVTAQANLVVAENAMKWQALRPAPDRYDFAGADELVVFAAMHGQKIRGHNLCWHQALPDWFEGTVTTENARQVLVQHIDKVAGRYAGRLHSWDVVNEAVEPRDGRPDGLRNSPWLRLVGPDYVELAFRTAREADPSALLTYNDYAIELDTEDHTEKRAQVLLLVRRLRARGIPIDAVGVQSHLDATGPRPGRGLQRFVRELNGLGLQVFLTELDINDQQLPTAVAARDAAVASVYRDYLGLMLAEPNVRAVLTWGITDKYTWLTREKARPDGKPQRSLPFDADLHPKPAFFAMRDAFDVRATSRPATPPSTQPDPYAPITPRRPQG
jgi:endo-1,4-beta-xylanase